MHGPTCIFWANLTPFSFQWATPGAVGFPFAFDTQRLQVPAGAELPALLAMGRNVIHTLPCIFPS